ncbi:MAG: hypothetical protein R3221_12720, partial [Spongiibacter sp.]|nr:hypothetical protein [Spongiibacter sp.]
MIKRDKQQVLQLDLDTCYVTLNGRAFGQTVSRHITLDQVLAWGPQIIISGGPGSGKTTTLLRIAQVLARALLINKPILAQRQLSLEGPLLLPVFVPLPAYLSYLRSLDAEVAAEQRSLAYFVHRYLREQTEAQDLPSDFFSQLLSDGRETADCLQRLSAKLSVARSAGQNPPEQSRPLRPFLNELRQMVGEVVAVRDELRGLLSRADAAALLAHLDAALEQAGQLVQQWQEEETERVALDRALAAAFAEEEAVKLDIARNSGVIVAQAQLRLELAQRRISHARIALKRQRRQMVTTQAAWITALNEADEARAALLRLVQRQDVMLLLDGLDEVPNETEWEQVRSAVVDFVQGRPKMGVVVSSRTAVVRGEPALGDPFSIVHIEPLTPGHVSALIRQAYAAIYLEHGQIQQAKAAELIQAIQHLEEERRRRLGGQAPLLVTSPLLVRMLLVVHFSEKRLPEQRAELYMKAIDALLLPEYASDKVAAAFSGRQLGARRETHRDLVQHIAFHMHKQGPTQGREIDEATLRDMLKQEPSFAAITDDFISLTR